MTSGLNVLGRMQQISALCHAHKLAGWLCSLGCFLVLLGLATWPLDCAYAVPACPEGCDVTQPGGNAIRIYLRGDEFLHWDEDASGHTILRDAATKKWVYAKLDARGQLTTSSAVVGEYDPETLSLPKKLLPAGAISDAQAAAASRSALSVETGVQLAALKIGTMKNLVVLVGFSDKPFTRTKAEYEALFNTVGYTLDGAQGSVKDYYNEVSYNQLNVDSVVAEPVTLANGYAYYGTNNVSGSDLRPKEMVQEALAALEARGFDFSTLDMDNDGFVDGLTVIHAGGGEEYSGNDTSYIWSHKSSISTVTYDGKKLYYYHTEPERRGWDSSPSSQGITRIGVICHENGHFLGLPDLYDTGYDSYGVGKFCLMAYGSWNGNNGTQPAHMSAWCKKYLTWLTPTPVSASGTYSVPRVEDNQTVYRLSGGFLSTQYFLVENRQGFGFDTSLPGSTRGLLVWHIDETVANNNSQTHYKVDLEEASGTQHLELYSNSGDDADYFRSGTLTTFNYSTTPNSRNYAGLALGLDITAVSSSAATMTFTVSQQTLQLSSATYSVVENAGSVRVYVSRAVGSAGLVSVSYATANASATSGSDYTTKSGTLSWPDGDTADKFIDVTILDNTVVESSETFTVTLSSPIGAYLGSPGTATITIIDWEPGKLQFKSATNSFAESVGSAGIYVSRTNGSSGAASVNFATANGSATSGSDYTANSGTLSWADGDAADKYVGVSIQNDSSFESNETFTVTLSGVTGALLGTPVTNTAIIIDDEPPPITSIGSSSANGTYGAGAAIGVTLTFAEPVTLAGGNLVVTLETGVTDRQVTIGTIANTNKASGTYTVQTGDASADLAVKGIALSGGTLRDAAGNNADLSLPAGNNLNDAKDIVVRTSCTLAVSSARGGICPGTVTTNWGTALCQWVTNSPIAVGASTQYVCAAGIVLSNAYAQASTTNVTLTLTNSAMLTWQWQTRYWLSTQTSGNGSIAAANGWYAAGSNAVLTASAGPSWHFLGWGGNTNGCAIADNVMTAAMSQARTAVAFFAENLAPLGSPEPWLCQYGLTNESAAAEELKDTDGDGMFAWQEYEADTDPTNSASVLRITGVTLDAGVLRVDWKGGRWAKQYIDARGNLAATNAVWTCVMTNDVLPTSATNFMIQGGVTNPVRFYRIRVTR